MADNQKDKEKKLADFEKKAEKSLFESKGAVDFLSKFESLLDEFEDIQHGEEE